MIAAAAGLLLCIAALAAPCPRGLTEAETHYRAGRYEAALAEFKGVLASLPEPDGSLLYDIGNCAFRLKRYAEAVLYYRRALLRLPRDPDVRFNLRLAEQKLGIEPPAGESFLESAKTALESFTPGELLWVCSALELGALVLVFAGRRRKTLRVLGVALLVPALAAGARAASALWLPGPSQGIVVAPEVPVRSEPREDLPVVLTLKAGESVLVEGGTDRWLKVRHGKSRGWAEKAGIGVVD